MAASRLPLRPGAHGLARASAATAAAALALVLLAATPPAAAGGAPAAVEARVAVVVFDSSGLIDDQRLSRMLEPFEARVGPVEYRVSFTVRAAPAWAVEGLARELGSLYEAGGAPPWAPRGWLPPGGYAWLPADAALEAVWRWAVRVAGDPGSAGYYSLAVVLGDVDGASRVYRAPGGLEGLRAWAAGDRPLWLVDLTAAPALLGGCGAASPAPPLWLDSDPTLTAAEAVEAHARGHVAGPARPLPRGSTLVLLLVPLAGAEPGIDVAALEAAVAALAPWAGAALVVETREPPAWLEAAYMAAEAAAPEEGPVKLAPEILKAYASIVASERAARCASPCPGVAVIVAAPRPLEETIAWGDGWALATLPWGGASSEAAALHALALAAGLAPPGLAAGDAVADQAPSPASCIPGAVEAYMNAGYYYDMARIAAATAAMEAPAAPEVLGLLAAGRPLAAVAAAYNPAEPPGSAAGAAVAGEAGPASHQPQAGQPREPAGAPPEPVNEAAPVEARPAPRAVEEPAAGGPGWARALAAFLATAWLGVAGLAVAGLAARRRAG